MSKGHNSKTVDSSQRRITEFCSPSKKKNHDVSESPSSSSTDATIAGSSSKMPAMKLKGRTPICTSPSKRQRQSIDDASSEASDSSDTSEDSIQPTAIHKIIFERFRKRLRTQSNTAVESTPEEQIIDTIVKEYNENHKRKTDCELDGEDTNTCFQEVNSNPIELSPIFKKFLRRDQFSVKLFVKETFSQNYILKWNDSSLRNCNIHIIWFFYRPSEIFALTTNQGWNVVHNYSDFHFPIKTAARLCSEEGPKSTAEQVLIGEITKQSKTSKIGKGTNIDANPVLCNSYTAEIRKDASILKFPCFEIDREKKRGRTCIEFGVAFVRFKRRFKVEDIPLILDHLSAISRGERTFKFERVATDSETLDEVSMDPSLQQSSLSSPTHEDNIQTQVCPGMLSNPGFVSDKEVSFGEESFSDLYQFSQEQFSQLEESSITMMLPSEEADAAIYRRNLAKVPPELSDQLDQALVNVLFEGIRFSKLSLGCYIFSYNHFPETFNELSELFLNKTSLETLPVHPTLSDVCGKIRPWIVLERLRNDIRNNIKIKPLEAETRSKNKINWFDFVEAEMFHEDRIFWRIRKIWCTVQPAYIFSSHAWFKEFLKTHLVIDNGDKHLTFPWKNSGPKRRTQQHITNNVNKFYIDQYNGKEGYFLPPSTNQYLFDILYFDKSKPDPEINIYFVSSDFNSQTAEVSLRISRCREEILLSRKQIPSGYFYTLFKESFKNDFDENRFKEMLFRCNFVYALAHTPDKLTGFDTSRMTDSDRLTRWMKRSFLKEKDAPAAITTIHIQRLLRKPGCPLSIKDMEKVLEMNPLEGPGEDEIGVYTKMSKFIHKRLFAEGYVQRDLPTLKFLYSNVHCFSLGLADCEMRAEYTKKIFAVMTHFQPQYASLKATIELKNVATTPFLNTKFKIYEIEGDST
ncbi:unnamed protein product [Allacma fusca]|uniref:Uncharacterized protein n=1 Tax=Allacma fusca TaxID=39272 RepID=A0A8J2K2J2_9HEXA|nr:unnamed protein product [Allacma fusca]